MAGPAALTRSLVLIGYLHAAVLTLLNDYETEPPRCQERQEYKDQVAVSTWRSWLLGGSLLTVVR